MTRTQGILDFKLYKKILDEAVQAGATQVSLENFGESFLDPYFIKRAKYAKGRNFEIFTITNGSLVTEDISRQLVELEFDKIRFSMEGATKETFEKVRCGLKYKTVKSNILKLKELREKAGKSKPQILVFMVCIKENEYELYQFIEKWGKLADGIEVWKPHNWGDGRTYRDKKNIKKRSCGRPFKGPIQIQWDGKVVPCCFDYNSNIVLGDATKNTLHEILHGEEYERLRNAHRSGNFSEFPFCDCCDQLCKRENILIYSNIKKPCKSAVGLSNTNYVKLD